MFGQGVSGLLPKWVSSYFPVDKRAAGLGFCYNVGALGGAVGPVLGAAIADQLGLGMALAILSFGFAAIVMVSIGANIPRLLQKMVGPGMFVLKMETTKSSKKDDHHDTSVRYRRVRVASGTGAGS